MSLYDHRLSRRAFVAGGIAAALALAGCGQQNQTSASAASATSGASTGSKVVRIGFAGNAGEVSLIESAAVAYKEGFLDEELGKVGYTAQYQGFSQAGPAINEAFSSSSLDVAEYGDLPGYTVASKGIGVKAFATATSQNDMGILVAPNSGISTVADLKGKRVVVGFGTVMQRYLLESLAKENISANDLSLINSVMDGPTMIAGGQADAFVSVLSMLYPLEQKGTGTVVITSKDDESLSATILFFGRDQYLKENLDAAKAIIRALKRAKDYAAQNPDKARDDLATKTTTGDTIAKVYDDDTFASFDPKISDDVKAKLEGLGEFAIQNKIVTKQVSVDDLVDTSYYEEA